MLFLILSRMVVYDSLALFGGQLWRFENPKFIRQLQPTQIFFLVIFLFK